MNKIKIKLSDNDQNINIPIQMDFNHYGQDELIDVYEEDVKFDIVGRPPDFEVDRFGHESYIESFANYNLCMKLDPNNIQVPPISAYTLTFLLNTYIRNGKPTWTCNTPFGNVWILSYDSSNWVLRTPLAANPYGSFSNVIYNINGQTQSANCIKSGSTPVGTWTDITNLYDVSVTLGSCKPGANPIVLNPYPQTKVNYRFWLFDSLNGNVTNPSDWHTSYIDSNYYTDEQLYFGRKRFRNSFYKIDLYDSNEDRNQKIYLTIIIPTQQGLTELINQASFSLDVKDFNVPTAEFILDSVGPNKEGFYIYWIKDREFVNISTFYMSIKFFDAAIGQFKRMMTENQASLSGGQFNFDPSIYFYRRVKLDYTNKTYKIYDYGGLRAGVNQPINWYEYVNPK